MRKEKFKRNMTREEDFIKKIVEPAEEFERKYVSARYDRFCPELPLKDYFSDNNFRTILLSSNKKIRAHISRYLFYYKPYIFKLSKPSILKFIQTHNAWITIAEYVEYYQFTKKEIKDILMKDTMMRRNSYILGGNIRCKIYMTRAIIRRELCVDNGRIDYFLDFYSDDSDAQYDILRYTLKFNKRNIMSKHISNKRLKNEHADILLKYELK